MAWIILALSFLPNMKRTWFIYTLVFYLVFFQVNRGTGGRSAGCGVPGQEPGGPQGEPQQGELWPDPLGHLGVVRPEVGRDHSAEHCPQEAPGKTNPPPFFFVHSTLSINAMGRAQILSLNGFWLEHSELCPSVASGFYIWVSVIKKWPSFEIAK